MTEADIRIAMALLGEEGKAWVNAIKLGRWYIGNDGGTLGVFDKKFKAIDHALFVHAQCKERCKVTRWRKGAYEVAVLDVDEDPREKFYHRYRLEKITSQNILEFTEYALCNVLPEEYFEPYSELYRVREAFSNGKVSEEEALQKFKDLGY